MLTIFWYQSFWKRVCSLLEWLQKVPGKKMSCILCPVTLSVSYILYSLGKLELVMAYLPHLIRIAFQMLVYRVLDSVCYESVINVVYLLDEFNKMCRRLWSSFLFQLDCGIHPGLEGMDALPYIDLIDPAEIDLLLISQ